jgi:hypothetical protein
MDRRKTPRHRCWNDEMGSLQASEHSRTTALDHQSQATSASFYPMMHPPQAASRIASARTYPTQMRGLSPANR